jgi:hypothetical protein
MNLPEGAPGQLKKECERLLTQRDEILKKRADADKLTANIAGPQYDHSRVFELQISAIEDEISLEEQLIVFELACSQCTADRKSAAKAQLHAVELAARDKLAIPDAIPVPVAVLQNMREWWIARSAHDGIADWPIDTRPREENMLVLQNAIVHLKKRLEGEPARLRRAAEVEQREADFQTKVTEQREAHRRPYDRRQRAVAELLGDAGDEPEPEPQQSRPRRGAKA